MIKLTPLEPYFFGGERIFEFEGNNKHYFIRSLDTPSQTTLFGALRYIGIRNPEKGFRLDNEDKANIGSDSFRINDVEKNNFGKIVSISPLFLFGENEGFLIKTPLDHQSKCECGKFENAEYTPFEKYSESVQTVNGMRCFPLEYDAKVGLANSWLSLKNRSVFTNLFHSVTRVGIDKIQTEKAFFKKEFRQLESGFSFVFFAEVKEGFKPFQNVVYLGQGKSPFKVEWLEDEEEPVVPSKLFRKGMLYAQSDIYVKKAAQLTCGIYEKCKFVCAETRDFRVFYTNYDRAATVTNRFQKSGNIQLIQAGSMFLPRDDEVNTVASEIQDTYEHAAKAGFNKIIIGGNAL